MVDVTGSRSENFKLECMDKIKENYLECKGDFEMRQILYDNDAEKRSE